jgi:hypothetical protein
MTIVDALFNAAGGGIFGSALHCVTDWIDTKNKIALMNAQVNAAEKTEAWKSFTESQKDAPAVQIPANAPSWVSAIYLIVDSVKQLTRPLLTWAAVGIILTVYLNSTVDKQGEIAAEILFGSFTAIFWWFGARYAKSK